MVIFFRRCVMLAQTFFRLAFCALLTGYFSITANLAQASVPFDVSGANFASGPAFQLAKTTFLPEYGDDLGISDFDTIEGNYNQPDCSDYTLYSCPEYANCSSCPSDKSRYKLISCQSGFKLSNGSCLPTNCSALGYEDSVPSGQICTSFSTYSMTCFKDCRNVSCTGYSQNCNTKPANVASMEKCPECSDADANCGDNSCKIGQCNPGYTLQDGACVKVCSANSCSAFPLLSCPENGNCSSCTPTSADCSTGMKRYKLDSCADGFEVSGNNCVAKKTCEENSCAGYSLAQCPTDLPNGFSCQECQMVNADCSTGAKKYKVVIPTCETGFVLDPASGQCVAAAGAILYSDMSVGPVSEYDEAKAAGKTAIGVVFDPVNKKAIDLKYFNVQWQVPMGGYLKTDDISDLRNVTYEEADMDGEKNTQAIYQFMQKNSGRNFPIATTAQNRVTAGTKKGDWYIPAVGEMYQIIEMYPLLDQSLTAVGGQTFPKTDFVNGNEVFRLKDHWSSTEYDAESAWHVATDLNSNIPVMLHDNIWKGDSGILRLVIHYGN